MKVQLPDRIEDVVVVVHNDDIDLFCLQLQTFELFLETCKLHIVINENQTDLCRNRILRELENNGGSKHTIKIWNRNKILDHTLDVSGWTSQQLLKLLIPLKRDWIVFDCKDLLIRPITLIELDRKQRKDYENLSLEDPQGEFWQGCLALGKKHKFPKIDPKLINMNHTPRVIDNRVIRKILSLFKTDEDFIKWFCSFKVQGEFILHDYIAEVLKLDPKLRFPQGFNVGIWREHIFKNITFDKIPPTATVYKCHRRVYNVQENREIVDKWMHNVMETYKKYRDAINGK